MSWQPESYLMPVNAPTRHTSAYSNWHWHLSYNLLAIVYIICVINHTNINNYILIFSIYKIMPVKCASTAWTERWAFIILQADDIFSSIWNWQASEIDELQQYNKHKMLDSACVNISFMNVLLETIHNWMSERNFNTLVILYFVSGCLFSMFNMDTFWHHGAQKCQCSATIDNPWHFYIS